MKLLPIALSTCLTMLLGMGTAESVPSTTSIVSSLLGKSSSNQSSSQPPASLQAQIDELRNKVSSAEAELAKQQLDATAKELTTGATQDEIGERKFLIQRFIRLSLQIIDNLVKLPSLQQSRLQLEKQVEQWDGLPEPPPYSFRKVDNFGGALRSLKIRMQLQNQLLADIRKETENRSDRLKTASEKLRQAEERLENKSPIENTGHIIWLRDQALWYMRSAEVNLNLIKTEQSLVQEELAKIRLQLALTETEFNAAKQHVVYPETDRKDIRQLLATEQQNLDVEFEHAYETLATSRKQLDAAKEGHAQTQNDTVHSAADFRLELQQVQAENADFNFKTLNILNEILKLRQGLHEFRWSLADSKDAEKIRLAYGRISQAESQISPVKGYVLQQLKLADNTISDLEKRLILAGSPQERANFQQLIELYNQRRTTIHRVLSGFDRTEQLLEFFKQDLDDRHATESLSERINNRLVQLKNLSAQIWQFELFAVEDSIEIDGKAITGKRSVTVGKVSTALMILIIGFWIVIQLSQRVERMAVNRVGMDASHARIARRWLLLILGMILVVISLEMVRIPLTVFAFMGGVLAIGSGFAMQNLLKNLISGLMLLMERPFRPGDLVEVGGIRGRVIDIGMRSSQIRDGNGIETVIPNSTFVETNVTNWTLSSKSVRIVIKIGVDYAAPVNELTDLLIEIAHRHGMVQDKPPPQVMFEDFGSDALLFGLYVWVELNNDLDWRVVASDLRYMINKTLAAHNIVIAYPQRDIHLDTRRPLEVKVIADSSDVATTELNGHALP